VRALDLLQWSVRGYGLRAFWIFCIPQEARGESGSLNPLVEGSRPVQDHPNKAYPVYKDAAIKPKNSLIAIGRFKGGG